MRYLLCEDSTGGFAFWESVNRLLLDGYFDVVDHSAGRGGLAAVAKACVAFPLIRPQHPKGCFSCLKTHCWRIESLG
jgi:hypothetical protein